MKKIWRSPYSGITIIFAPPRQTFATGPSQPCANRQSAALQNVSAYAILTVRRLHYHHIGTCTYFIKESLWAPFTVLGPGSPYASYATVPVLPAHGRGITPATALAVA